MSITFRRYLLFTLLALAFIACDKEPKPSGNNPTPKEWTISGTVIGDDGTLLEGVVVSDGQYCAKTDKQGQYKLPTDLSSAEYVMVSTPSGYAAPVEKGHAIFWKWLKDSTKDSNGKYKVDFTLKKIANPERYKVLIFADPQPRRNNNTSLEKVAYQSLECCDDMYRDMKEYVAANSTCPVYGIGLGDIVHQDLTLLPVYKDGMATTGVITYNVIGNHDQGHRKMDDSQSSKDFEKEMGPVNYSFNLGGIHYLMLDNMISPDASTGLYSDESCETGLTDEIWEWVQNDLANVSFDTPLMVCAHSPMMRMESGSDRTGRNLVNLKYLLRKYKKAYVWAGHTHTTFNYVDKNNPVIETHTVSRVTGALWTNEYLGSNGTPRGYVVFDYDNGNISWKFKPIYYQTGAHGGYQTGDPDYTWRDWDYQSGKAVLKSNGKDLDESYQMQVFPPKSYGDNYVYVNVFLWDELWDTPRLAIEGDFPAVMKRVTEENYRYSLSDWDITNFYHNSKWSFMQENFVPDKNNCSSMFRAFVDTEHGTGTVTVKDRFGNTHSSTITW